jgi:hypothetical protein
MMGIKQAPCGALLNEGEKFGYLGIKLSLGQHAFFNEFA